MSGLHAHSHTHAPATAPETRGSVIHQAGLYNAIVSRMIKKSEPTILKLAGVKPGSTVLDVGCGPGSLTLAAKKQAGTSGEVYGLDASVEMIEVACHQAKKANLKVNFEAGVAESLPYEDAKFDVVLSRLAFHHFTGELKNKAAAEIYRVLKPGGVCLIVDFDQETLPGPAFLKNYLAGMHGMMRVDVSEYIPLLEASGFTEIQAAPTGHRMLSYVRGVKAVAH